MTNDTMLKKIFLTLLLTSSVFTSNDEAVKFIDSCVDHYDFKIEGRYAHEYHPYILDKYKIIAKTTTIRTKSNSIKFNQQNPTIQQSKYDKLINNKIELKNE